MTVHLRKMMKYVLILGMIILAFLMLTKINWNEVIQKIEQLPNGIKQLCMIILISLQIFIAFIPGEPFELASGYMFGSFWGTIVCLIGSMFGTAIVFAIVKKYGVRVLKIFFKDEKIEEIQDVLTKQKSMFWIFILFLIPGSPKDMMTYIMPLGDVSLFYWLLLTTIGRIPSIITSTYLAAYLKEQNYLAAIIVFVVTIVLVVISTIYYNKMKEQG